MKCKRNQTDKKRRGAWELAGTENLERKDSLKSSGSREKGER